MEEYPPNKVLFSYSRNLSSEMQILKFQKSFTASVEVGICSPLA